MHERTILLPEARAFGDVLEYVAEWDHETMSHRSGALPSDTPRPLPRIVGDAQGSRRRGNAIGPFCTIELRQIDAAAIGQPARRSIAVRATDAAMGALRGRLVTPDDELSFKVIAHTDGRALIVAQHGYIIGDHWLAYVDPATLPPYPFHERDRRYREICDALREQGHTPYVRHLPGGGREVSSRTLPGRAKATIAPDGAVEQIWPDGSVTR